MDTLCSECGQAGAKPLTDTSHLGGYGVARVGALHGGVAGALLAAAGMFLARSVARAYFENLRFCDSCRNLRIQAQDPFALPNVLCGIGFFTILTFIGAPLGWLFFLFAFMVLRSRLRQFRGEPKASVLPYAMNALGVFFVAILAHTAAVAVFGGVVYYMERKH